MSFKYCGLIKDICCQETLSREKSQEPLSKGERICLIKELNCSCDTHSPIWQRHEEFH